MKLRLQEFDININGRDFCVGDIHGYYSVLRNLLKKVKFDPTVDRLFALGDLIDRGPESAEVLDWLGEPWFFSIKGNHEEMIYEYHHDISWHDSYAKHGGQWFIDLSIEDREKYVEKLIRLPDVFEIMTVNGKVGMVHAEVPVNDWLEFKLNFHNYQEQSLWAFDVFNSFNSGNNYPDNIEWIDHVIHGHTSVDKPTQIGNRYYIDTGYFCKTLTVMEISHPDGFRCYQ